MAYLEVPDTDLDADSPLLATVMIQLNDNIKANKSAEVTGGDGHNHAGGDGAIIPMTDGLDTSIQSEGSQSIATVSTWTPSAGIYNFVETGTGSGQPVLEIQIASTWRQATGSAWGTVVCDGTNMRFYNPDAGSRTVYYQKF